MNAGDIWSQEAARLFPSGDNFQSTTALQRQAFIRGVLFALSQVVTSDKLVRLADMHISHDKTGDTNT